jgi:methyl-accepting chemotaxis protein
VTTGVGALIMGVGAIAVMALIGTLVVIGKGLGEFATSILPFETMNVPRIKQNIQQLASISGDIDELMDISGGRGIIAQALSDHPLTELSEALGSYAGDMSEKINNITNLKTALKGFEFPKLPDGENGRLFSGDLIRGWTGEDFSGELKKLSQLQLAADLGTKLGMVGDGILQIGKGLGSITDKKVEHLEKITEALKDMKNVDLNFNANVTATDVSPTSTTQPQGQNNNVVVAPQVSNRVSNNIKRFNATGSQMMRHSALHYPSLG